MQHRWWCANPADPPDAPILLLRRSCWCTDPADALMLLMHRCSDALMLLNQDQDLLADLSIAICSSFNMELLMFNSLSSEHISSSISSIDILKRPQIYYDHHNHNYHTLTSTIILDWWSVSACDCLNIYVYIHVFWAIVNITIATLNIVKITLVCYNSNDYDTILTFLAGVL